MAHTDHKGHWVNKQGEHVHPDLVPVDKKLEDEVVATLIDDAKKLSERIQTFKEQAFSRCYDFIDLLRQEYGMDRLSNSTTGSVVLRSYDGVFEVQIQVAKIITFDNKLKLAKEKIDAYLEEKAQHADAEIQTLITKAFDVKGGKVDSKQVLSLKSYHITHPMWKEAMAMIDEATEIAGTKSYIRFKERISSEGAWANIPLDIASIPINQKSSL